MGFGTQAAALDEAGLFPAAAVTAFARSGLLAAPLPHALGGQGLGTASAAAALTAETLTGLGRAWLPLARIYEGHVNAVRLILRYGAPEQARDASQGALFAIWAAEAQPVTMDDDRVLHGRKSFASGAGQVTRPLVTARHRGAETLVLLRGTGRIVRKVPMSGMRGAGTCEVDVEGMTGEIVGAPDDYMRQPEISLGSWRALPGLLGGLQALVEVVARMLAARGRDADPAQVARFGQMLVARDTAALWVREAATQAEAADAGEDAAAAVKLARHAVDAACTLVLDHAKRAAGLSGFLAGSPVERLCRDIDTYRRQPALDEVLIEAARHILASHARA